VSSPCVPHSCAPRLTAPPRREWREKQAEEIARRDAASKATRQETIARAEQSIDKFYEEYNGRKERTIRENKCGPPRRRCPTACADAAAERRRRTTSRRSPTRSGRARRGRGSRRSSSSRIARARRSRAPGPAPPTSRASGRSCSASSARATPRRARVGTEQAAPSRTKSSEYLYKLAYSDGSVSTFAHWVCTCSEGATSFLGRALI
jgi:hypothetical protein